MSVMLQTASDGKRLMLSVSHETGEVFVDIDVCRKVAAGSWHTEAERIARVVLYVRSKALEEARIAIGRLTPTDASYDQALDDAYEAINALKDKQ